MNTEKYLHITINDNSFYIDESSDKKGDGALTTLKKIEEIVKLRLEYANRDDSYSQLDGDDLYTALRDKSEQILQRYTAKQERLNCLTQVIFHSKKLMNIHKNIQNYVEPPGALPVPNDLIPQILEELSLHDLMQFSETNRCAHLQADIALLHIAKKCGYEGLDIAESISYLKELGKELEIVPLPRELLVLRKGNKEVDGIKTLEKLRRQTDLSLVLHQIFDQEGVTPDITNFKKVMALFHKWPVASNSPSNIATSALLKSCEIGDAEVTGLLLKHGANPNNTLTYSGTPLSRAVDYNHDKTIRILLKAGAKIDFYSLAFTAGGYHRNSNPVLLKLLLEHTSNVNIQNADGDTVLHYAVLSGKSEIVSLLIKRGANPDLKNSKGLSAFELANPEIKKILYK